MFFRSHALTGTVASAILALTLSACGADDTPEASSEPTPQVTSTPSKSASTGPTPTAEPEGTVIDLTIGGSQPAARRVKIEVGEKVLLRTTATKAGSLHVHSTPEQELDFPAGTSDVTLVINQPGIVDVEDHDSDTVLLQLEVR